MNPNPRTHRTERITVRLTPSERAAIEQRAKESGRPPSALLREAALGVEIHTRPTQATGEVVYHLAKIGGNLNQLAHHANATGELRTTRRLHRLLDLLYGAIRDLRAPAR